MEEAIRKGGRGWINHNMSNQDALLYFTLFVHQAVTEEHAAELRALLVEATQQFLEEKYS